MLAMVLNWK